MASFDAGSVAPAAGGTAQAATQGQKAAAKPLDKKTITLTFEGKDLDLHELIQERAAEEDRTPSIELLRFVRKHFATAE